MLERFEGPEAFKPPSVVSAMVAYICIAYGLFAVVASAAGVLPILSVFLGMSLIGSNLSRLDSERLVRLTPRGTVLLCAVAALAFLAGWMGAAFLNVEREAVLLYTALVGAYAIYKLLKIRFGWSALAPPWE